MDTGRIQERERGPRRPVDGGAGSDDGARDGVYSLIVIVLLFVLALWAAAVLPQALQVATTAANASAAMFDYSERGDVHPRDIEEEQPEPPLAGGPPVTHASRVATHFLASLSDQS